MLSYQRFMLDYMKENREKELQYLDPRYLEFEDDFFDEAKDKSDVYKINFYLRDHLQMPKVHDELAKKRVQEAVIEFTGVYIDTHQKALTTSGPVYKITFGAKETQFLYDTFHTSAEEIIDMYNELNKETYYGKISQFITGFVVNAPHKLLLTAILIDAIQNDYKDIIECMEYLWAFAEYPMLFHTYWKTGVKEEVMNYTIEHLGSKFKISKMKNLQEFLKYDVTSAVKLFWDKLKTGQDNVYIDLMQSIRGRLNSSLKNIANAYYKNNEQNKTQHTTITTFDDGTIADQGGYVANMSQIIDRITTKFQNGEINASMVSISAESCKVDNSTLSGYISQIYSTKKNQVNIFIENVVLAYFTKYPSNQTIESMEFLNFGLALYRSIGTSKDPVLSKIRSVLNFWMNEIIGINDMYSSPTTKINYTRAIYNYMILMINTYAD